MLQPALKKVFGVPDNENLRDGREVRELMEDYRVETNGLVITIPAGFQTDGASIPRCLQWIVGASFDNGFRAAALVHDWLYYTHRADMDDIMFGYPKRIIRWIEPGQADACLLDLLAQNGVGWIRRRAIYHAVRLFGGDYWINNDADDKYLHALATRILERGGNPADYGLQPA
jgi:hypothetical protein